MKSKKHIVLLLTIFYLAIVSLLLHSSAFAPICPCENCADCCDCQRAVCIYFKCGCSNDPNIPSSPSCTIGCYFSCLDTYSSCLGNCEATTTTIPQSTTTTTAPATVIELSSFTATPKSGKVILTWATESETDNAGFNIYRATAEDGEYEKINSALILEQGSATQGASYEFFDSGLRNGKTYYYKLEDVDLNGVSTMHEAVKATPRWIYSFFK